MAYIVCDALGLDCGEYSFPYVTRWAEGSGRSRHSNRGAAIGCAKDILVGIDLTPDGVSTSDTQADIIAS